ncbi:MAG: hypothetical protein ACRCWQ_02695 [Bacilli bacterium]
MAEYISKLTGVQLMELVSDFIVSMGLLYGKTLSNDEVVAEIMSICKQECRPVDESEIRKCLDHLTK